MSSRSCSLPGRRSLSRGRPVDALLPRSSLRRVREEGASNHATEVAVGWCGWQLCDITGSRAGPRLSTAVDSGCAMSRAPVLGHGCRLLSIAAVLFHTRPCRVTAVGCCRLRLCDVAGSRAGSRLSTAVDCGCAMSRAPVPGHGCRLLSIAAVRCHGLPCRVTAVGCCRLRLCDVTGPRAGPRLSTAVDCGCAISYAAVPYPRCRRRWIAPVTGDGRPRWQRQSDWALKGRERP